MRIGGKAWFKARMRGKVSGSRTGSANREEQKGGRPANGIRARLVARLRLGFGTAPPANDWFERGMPVHRHYLEQFLAERAGDVRGRCLEFQEDTYTSRFCGSRVEHLDILHKERDPRASQATIIADLTGPNAIPDSAFDCIICTYVLHLVFELERLVAELYRILAPGGVLLVAVPNITINYSRYDELWRFTPEGLRRRLASRFGDERVDIVSYGNSFTAAGEIRGLTAGDFTPAELSQHDERFGLVVCARAIKSAGLPGSGQRRGEPA